MRQMPTVNLKNPDEIQERQGSDSSSNYFKVENDAHLCVSGSEKGPGGEKDTVKHLLNIFPLPSSKACFLNIVSRCKFSSPSGKFWQLAAERDEVSQTLSASTSEGITEYLNVSFMKKFHWNTLKQICKKHFLNPVNLALLVWITCVAVSGALLFLVMTGMLNHVLPKKSQRDAWFEVNNQILNALFTLMCLYQHPKRLYHLVLLIRWRPDDDLKLRNIYCKGGTYKPHEWAHMMVVVLLLQVNCFAQYALCTLNLAYRRSERPAVGVGVCISVAISCPAVAGLYTILSPLGREYTSEPDVEVQDQTFAAGPRLKSFEKSYSFVSRDDHTAVEAQPEWAGGLFNLWDDISVAYLSFFCGFCVFGWNMERLGFGNMYVHVATFLLFCTAPFWIFNLAAVNIDNEAVREALGLTGVVLCVFGLLYGGFWRIQIRNRFKLPPNDFCCGHPSVTDCAQWLCCCMCSLAQEVRTADLYDIQEDRLCRKAMSAVRSPVSPLGKEAGITSLRSSLSSMTGVSLCSPRLDKVVEEGMMEPFGEVVMKPPIPSTAQREKDHTFN